MLCPLMVPASRPVRILFAVLAVPALVGCSALGLPQAPGMPLVPLTQAATESPAPGVSPVLASQGVVASVDGYSLEVPTGWTATDLSMEDGLALADLLATIEPTLGAIGRQGLEAAGSPHLSLAVVDGTTATAGGYGPAVVVATLRTRGMDKATARNLVESLLGQATLLADVSHTVEGLPAGNAHRYSAIVSGDSGVTLRLEVFVFRVGGDSFVVTAVAPEDRFAGVQATFDAIVRSLRFGV